MNDFTEPDNENHAIPSRQDEGQSDGSLNRLDAMAAVDDWPSLVPLEMPRLDRFDNKVLTNWPGDYIRALSHSTETPPELALGLVLAACSTAVARRLYVQVNNDYSEPGNLWIAVALASGNRKSAVQSAATAPLMEWEKAQHEAKMPEIQRLSSEKATKEARARELRNQAAKEKGERKAEEIGQQVADIESSVEDIPTPPQLWTSDITPEKLGILMADHGERMAWLSSEGGLFDHLQGRYSNGIPNLELWLKSHAGDPERVHRASRKTIYLEHPLLTVGLSPQPQHLHGLARIPGFRGRGLLARFLYLIPPSNLGYRTLEDRPIPPEVKSDYHRGIHAMLEWPAASQVQGEESRHRVHLSQMAGFAWHEFRVAIEEHMLPGGLLEHYTDWGGKAPGAALRLALVLHGIEHAHGRPWEHDIAVETMEAALELMQVFFDHSLAVLGDMGIDPGIDAARTLWHWIERHRLNQFTLRNAHNQQQGTFQYVKDLRQAVDLLEERGYVRVHEQPSTGGRPPSPVVIVNPSCIRERS
ncbi:YfjI family protein [Halomonas cupida]|uniref:YfjI family protein n=1 Tax=Halomonas cupida TaxID=44933 RepID=UPI0039B5380B